MLDFLINNFESIIAGLFPSLVVVIPTVIALVKNVKVNRNVEDLQNSVIDFVKGQLDFKDLINASTKSIDNLMNDYSSELKKLFEDVKTGVSKDIEAIEESFKTKQEALEASYVAEVKRLNKRIKEEVSNVRDVYALREKGQEEVSDT
jgi:predicted butyrate kinase (DUF1464 family)